MIRYLSPCKSICQLDDTESYCIGCKRTVEEVGSWLSYSEEVREQLLGELEVREYDKEGNIQNS